MYLDDKDKIEFNTSLEKEYKFLADRKVLLERMLEEINQRIMDAPEGHLHIAKRGKYISYYNRTKKGDHTGEYIPRRNIILAYQLAQREYDEKTLKLLKEESEAITRLISIIGEYEKMTSRIEAHRKELINPILIEDYEYICQWESVEYQGKEMYEDETEFYTLRGEKVRSKSEVMIANHLLNNGIPYRYEFPVEVDGKIFYPDFYCLNVRTKEEIIFEHFGMMGNPDYVENMILKLRRYERAGYKISKNLIFTMETGVLPLSTINIQNMIDLYLK